MKKKKGLLCLYGVSKVGFPLVAARERGREKTFWFFRSFVCVHINVASFIYFFLKIFFICSYDLCMNNFLDMKHLCRIFMLMFVLFEIYYNVFLLPNLSHLQGEKMILKQLFSTFSLLTNNKMYNSIEALRAF